MQKTVFVMSIYNHFNPYDPLGMYIDPLPENATKEDYEELQRLTLKYLVRTVITFFILLMAFALCSLFTSCTTQKTVTSDTTDHRVTDLMQRMDSLMSVHSVVQQDSTWRQEILRQFQSIRERSDTSHTVVQDTAGNILRERIVINNTREVRSETDHQELTVMSHRLEQMDSTMQVMRQQLSHSDSLLQQSRKETVRTVETPATWWHNLQLWLGRMAMLALAVLLALWLLKKKIPSLPFGK